MTWPPIMININMGVWGIRHCFKAKLPYPLVCIRNFFKEMKLFIHRHFPPNFLIETEFHCQIWINLEFIFWKFRIKIESWSKVTSSQRGRAFFFGTSDISMVVPFTSVKFPKRNTLHFCRGSLSCYKWRYYGLLH